MKFEVILEVLRAAVTAALFYYLWNKGNTAGFQMQRGWKYVIRGFGLILFASVLDITDNFPILNHYVVIGDTHVEAFLEKVIGYLGGFVLLFIGYVNWIPLVTRLQESESELRQDEARFRNIIEASPVPYAINDDDQNIVYLNAAFIRVFGYTLADIPTLADWWPKAYPDPDYQQWVADEWQVRLARAARDGAEFQPMELRICCKDGNVRTAMVTAAQIGDSFNHMHLVILVDITERMQSEKALAESRNLLQTIIDSAPVRIFWKDRESRYLGCNPLFARDAGVEKPEDLIGKDDSRLVWKEQSSLYRADDCAVMDSGNAKLAFVEPQTTGDGRHIWLRTSKVPIRDVSNRVIGLLGIYDDVTDQLQAQQRLQESEERLREFTENVNAVFWISTPDKKQVEFVNHAYEQIWGRSCASLYANPQSWLDAIHPDDRQRVQEAVEGKQLLGTYDEEYRIVRPDGNIRHVHDFSFVVRNPSGSVYRLIGIAEDVTQRWLAEETVRESEARYRAIVEAQEDAVCRWLPDTTLTFVNSCYQKLFGHGGESLLGAQWISFIPESERESVAMTYQELAASPRRLSYEHTIAASDGSVRNILWTDIPLLNEQGKCIEFQSVGRDITEYRKAESNYRQLFNANPEPLIVYDPVSMELLTFNKSAQRAYGYTTSEIASMHLPDLYFADDVPELIQFLAQMKAKSGMQGATFHVWKHRRKDGSPMWVEVTGHFTEFQGKPVQVLHIHDISDRKRLEAEQDRLRGQLQQAQKMEAIGQLTGGIAHDFNNILAAILGYTGLALDRFVPDKESKLASYLKEVQTAGERARDLIAKMLAFSRGAKGESVALDAPPLVKEVVKTLRSVIPSTIELDAHIEEHLPAILSDPVQLHQVIMNLAINARDAIGEHGRIEIGLHNIGHLHASCDSCHHDIDGEYVELSFSDTGSGIPPEILRRIFDPFFTTKEVGKGTGMGLSMVHGIMHEHGGHIRVHSVPGKGTTFRLLFPIALARQTEAEPQLLSGKTNVRASARILVVDDESTVGRMLGEVLEAHGHQPTVLTGGAQALAVFESDPQGYDLVISDQTMPGMSGSELAQQLLAIRPDLPIFLCTGYSDTIDAEGAKKIGVRQYLQKPVSIPGLLGAIETCIQAKDSRV